MNKKLPYEEALGQQLSRLPLPDEDASWQKMQELLDKKKRRAPFFFFRDHKGKNILAFLLLLGFLVVMHTSRQTRTTTAPPHPVAGQSFTKSNKASKPDRPDLPSPSKTNPTAGKTSKALNQTSPAAALTNTTLSLTPTQSLSPAVTQRSSQQTGKMEKEKSIPAPTVFPVGNAAVPGRSLKDKFTPKFQYKQTHEARQGGERTEPLLIPISAHLVLYPLNTTDVAIDRIPAFYTGQVLAGLNNRTKSQNGNKQQENLSRSAHKSFFVRAGVGIQQPIPIGGQKQVGIYHNGNKNPLSDYIPSFFLRGEREGKWYLQAEFSYAAPKLVKDFAYSRRSFADTASRTVTTSQSLKKVYYRELPLSFNYYLRSNWSVGAGASYGWFQGAITEKQTASRNLLNQPGPVSKQIVPIEHFTDSFLYRSHTYLLLQTNYQWQSLSVGLRFSKDVQPYIKYTLPDGTVADKKNWSLELLVRLGLWKSARF